MTGQQIRQRQEEHLHALCPVCDDNAERWKREVERSLLGAAIGIMASLAGACVLVYLVIRWLVQ